MFKSVRGRLSAAFGSMVVLVAVVAFIGAKGMEDGRSDYLGYVEGTSQRIDALGDVLEAADARAIAARNLVLLTDASEAEVEKAAVQAAHRKMNAAIERLGTLMGAAAPLPEAQSAQFAKVVEAERRYGPVALAIVELAAGGRRADAIARINSECRPLLATLIAEVDRLVQMSHEAARESAARADRRHAFDRNLMIAGVLAAFVAGGLLAVAITRSVLGTLGAEPVALNAAVSRLASGDLVTEILLQPGDRHSTLAAVRRMQASLAAIVTTVRGNSDSVATASAQIAQGNLHLSQRTEEQASACQQTSATMDELSATVSHNAHNAAEASRLAQGASELAQRGGEVVGQVVETMRDIERSSSKISEITGVIDGIAFQTNLLALNAAVEAARAGEQGRGFGVVASEVRTLARRSADAAREIKALITGSVEQVGRGGRLVDDGGRRMAEIVGAIQGVNAVVTEISTATAEQSTGVEQVGQAIGQIDQVTQQNSALVEEASAAADSLKEQARQLVQTVATFQV